MAVPSSLPPQKKRKTVPSTSGVAVDDLEQKLTTAISEGTSLNPLAELINFASTATDPVMTHKAIYALYRVSVLVIAANKLNGGKEESDEARTVRAWISTRLSEFVDFLCGLLKDSEKALRMAALPILMSLLKHLSTSLTSFSSHPQIHLPHFRKIVHALLQCPRSSRPSVGLTTLPEEGTLEADVRDAFLESWLGVHDDIRWFFFRESALLLRSSKQTEQNSNLSVNLLSLLERLTTMPTKPLGIHSFWIAELSKPPASSDPKRRNKVQKDPSEEQNAEVEEASEDDWRAYFDDPPPVPEETASSSHQPRTYKLSVLESLHSLPSHRVQFSSCWLTLLPHLSSSETLSSRALSVLHIGVMPHLVKPERLMDWVAGCVDFGGSIGLIALNALFTLMTEHKLEYPDFYKCLYAFLTRDVLHLKYRARFFRLTELFLSSTHLPSALLASFVKRLSRLSLSAPPAAIVMIIPFVYNILKRHPALMVMIHSDVDDISNDPFDAKEPSPLLTNAISSSLWELSAQRNHYLSSVSTLAKILSEAFTKPSYAMEDFLDHTYGTLFDTEVKRKLRKDPALVVDLKADGLFPSKSAAGEESMDVEMDAVSELWAFS